MQPWCNTISSTGAIGTTSASTDTYKSSVSSSSRGSNSGTTPFSTRTTSGTSATTSYSTTPGGSAEKTWQVQPWCNSSTSFYTPLPASNTIPQI